ncbi:MAG: DUF4365 domain-containing protein [Gemmataceae bacterium]
MAAARGLGYDQGSGPWKAEERGGMLIRSHRQEALSRAYVQAIAARCGLACGSRDFDYGIDLTLHTVRRAGGRYVDGGVCLDLQLKSTTGAALTPSHVLYDVEVKTYDDLRDPAVICPRVLVLFVMPEAEAEWTDQTEDHLLLRHCAYWMSLRGMPGTPNTATVRVAIPRTNLFSVGGVRRLMERVERGQEL